MNNKIGYIILLVLYLLSFIGFVFFREKILFFLYGFDQSLIDANTPESFTAFRTIATGKKIFLAVSILLSFGCVIASYNMRKSNDAAYRTLAGIFFYFSILTSLFLCIGAVLGSLAPKRVL